MTPQQTPTPPRALTIREAAATLGLSRYTVQDLIAEGRLPAVQIGRLWRIPVTSIDALLADTAEPKR